MADQLHLTLDELGPTNQLLVCVTITGSYQRSRCGGYNQEPIPSWFQVETISAWLMSNECFQIARDDDGMFFVEYWDENCDCDPLRVPKDLEGFMTSLGVVLQEDELLLDGECLAYEFERQTMDIYHADK